MGAIYARAIINGEMKYSDVKKLWQAKTKQALKDKVASGEITAEQYEEFVGEPYEA